MRHCQLTYVRGLCLYMRTHVELAEQLTALYMQFSAKTVLIKGHADLVLLTEQQN